MSDLGQTVREKIEALKALSVEATIAVRMIELGKNPDAEVEDYLELVKLSPSLSAKIIAVANSSWCSPSQRITTVRHAMMMIGTRQIRVITIGYCMESAYQDLELDHETTHAFWKAAVSKAVATRWLFEMIDPRLQEEAYLAAILSDIAVAILADANSVYMKNLLDPEVTIDQQLRYEKDTFGMNHAEAGQMLCQQLDLPEFFQKRIGEHHRCDSIGETLADPAACADSIVAHLPHDIRQWKPRDLGRIDIMLALHFAQRWPDTDVFRDHLQREVDTFLNE